MAERSDADHSCTGARSILQEQVIDLITRVTRVSVETMAITEAMKTASDAM